MTSRDCRALCSICASAWAVCALLLSACAPKPIPPLDAAADRINADATADLTPDVAADAVPDVGGDAPAACRVTADCGVGRYCDAPRGRCVECLLQDHCAADGRVCSQGRCVASVPCTSSRTCPDQVCDPAGMRCVDCVGDVDCGAGLVCRSNLCTTAAVCSSSRECSAAGLVCDAAAGRCVECVADGDCAMGRRCNASRVCEEGATCTPGTAFCVSQSRTRVCDARGVAREADCAAGESCSGGVCRAPTCTPGAASCANATTRQVCAPDGRSSTMVSCAAGEVCDAGACRAEAPTCPTGQTRCGTTCVSLQTDAMNCGACGRGCVAGQACVAGACAAMPDDLPPLNQARWGFGTVVQPDGRIFVIGGYGTTARTSAIGTFEVYDPATGRWTTRPTPFSLGNVSAVGLADGRIYVANGAQTGFIGQGYLYDVGMDRWTTSRARVNDGGIGVARAQDGMVYVFGGGDNPARIRRYNPTDDSITTQVQTITPVRDPLPVLVPDGRLLLMGGDMSNNIPTYAPASGTAGSLRAGFASPRAAGAAVRADDGRIYYAGGFLLTLASTTMSFPDLYALDLTSNTMTALAPMPEPRTYFALVVRPGGRLTAIGGYSSTTMSVLASTRTYTIATNTWR